jgi:transposase
LERVAWKHSPEERLRIRRELEKPILDKLARIIKDRLLAGGLLPKSTRPCTTTSGWRRISTTI